MPTLWYNYCLLHSTPLDGLIAHTHALCITETAAQQALTITEPDIIQHYRHFAITGTPEQLLQLLTTLTARGICGFEVELPAAIDRTPFDAFGAGLIVTRST